MRYGVPVALLYGMNFRTLDSKTQFTKVSALLTNCISASVGATIIFSAVPVLSQSTEVVVTFVKVAVSLIQGV